jgi:hypothetical protein
VHEFPGEDWALNMVKNKKPDETKETKERKEKKEKKERK